MNIVTIGGGTGTFTVLSGLKRYPVNLAAIVSMADDGGSTGRLRDEFGMLPVGDIRMALAALAEDSPNVTTLRELFLYRFEKGEGLSGHNLGNLFLVALSEMLGDSVKAVEVASRILRVQGKVIPITAVPVNLIAEYTDGTKVVGQSAIDAQPVFRKDLPKIVHLTVDPIAEITKEAKEALMQAECIILGPGDLYTSLLADIVVKGTKEVLQSTNAKFIYILNLMTKLGQTHGLSARGHVDLVSQYVGRSPDVVIVNTAKIPLPIIRKYAKAHEHLVQMDFKGDEPYKVVKRSIIKPQEIYKSSTDVIRRSLIRHDPDKLAKVIMNCLE